MACVVSPEAHIGNVYVVCHSIANKQVQLRKYISEAIRTNNKAINILTLI